MSARLRIAVQRGGRLGTKSLELVESAGFRVMRGANDLLYRVENAPIDLLCVRDDDIPNSSRIALLISASSDRT